MSNTDTAATDDETQTVDSKSIFESRRAWGALMVAIPLVIQLLGINLTPDQQAQIAHGIQSGQSAVANVMIALGAVQMLVGCWRARQPLHIGTPYSVDTSTGKKIAPVKALPLTGDVARIMDEHPVVAAEPVEKAA